MNEASKEVKKESPHGVLTMTLREGWKVTEKRLKSSGILVGNFHASHCFPAPPGCVLAAWRCPEVAFVSLLLSLKYSATQCTLVGPTD